MSSDVNLTCYGNQHVLSCTYMQVMCIDLYHLYPLCYWYVCTYIPMIHTTTES